MTVTFENDNDVIVYALEKIISYARKTQQVFVAQCVWWLASIVGLDQGLINHIDNLQSRIEVTDTSESVDPNSATTSGEFDKEQLRQKSISPVPRDIQEETRQDQVLKECEEYLRESRRLRDIATLKSKGTTRTGRINPTRISKKTLKKKDRPVRQRALVNQYK
jgi:hypothetical protein